MHCARHLAVGDVALGCYRAGRFYVWPWGACPFREIEEVNDVTLYLTGQELGALWAALRFKPFQAALQAPQTKRATRDTYRTLTEKLREARDRKPDPTDGLGLASACASIGDGK